MRRFLRSQRGISFIEILISSALIIMIALAGFTVIRAAQQGKKRAETLSTILQYRKMLVEVARSTDALIKTGTNDGIPCFQTLMNCGPGNTPTPTLWKPFDLYNEKNAMVTQNPVGAGANFGFDSQGNTCTTFPSLQCPFQFVTEWRAECKIADNNCTSPQIKMRGTFNIAPAFQISYRAERFNFNVTLGQSIGSYEQGCLSVGGIYVPGNPPACNLPMVGDCPPIAGAPFQYVVGYNRLANTKICRGVFQNAMNGAAAPGGTVIVGTDGNGNPVIVPIKPNPATCPKPPCAYDTEQNPFGASAINMGGAVSDGGTAGGDGGCGAGDGCN